MKENEYDGFTLAELLIVVAIIAVLVAIAIPVFTNQLEKSREAVDLANVRSMYAAVMVAATTDEKNTSLLQVDGTYKGMISPLTQKVDDWTTNIDNMTIGDVPSSEWIGKPSAEGTCTVTFSPTTNKVTIEWSGDTPAPGEDNNKTTQEQAETANNAVIDGVSTVINTLVNNNTSNIQHSAKVEITVTVNGDATITVSNAGGSLSDEMIKDKLKQAGYLSEDGKVSFDPNDTRYPNGYRIRVNHNNGNNQVKIVAL